MKKLILKKAYQDSSSVLDQQKRAAVAYSIRYADELNAEQLQAVMHDTGAALVIAGAGTGKTRTLTYRVARLIEDGVPPESILLLTFTRKAASEMLRRAAQLLDGRCEAVSGGTFHSFAHGYLRSVGKALTALGYESNFSVLDQSDAEDVMNLLRSQYVESSAAKERKRRFPRKDTLIDIVSKAVNCQTSIESVVLNDYPQFAEDISDIQQLCYRYAMYKRHHNLMDYDDLLAVFLELMHSNPELKRHAQRRYQYIMVDEYQDTNALQHALVLTLAGLHENVLVVGDDAQSIYAFRGANVDHILRFPEAFRHCRIIRLEENYRSTQPILSLANEIMRRAVWRYDKELYSRKAGSTFPAIIQAEDEQQQSQFVVQQIMEYYEEGISLEDIAVLIRSSYHSFDLEIELNRANIPYRKFGGIKFIETAHVKDVIAHLRVLVNPKDIVSWNRILLLLEGVGPRTANAVIQALLDGRITLHEWRNLRNIVRNDEQIALLFGLLERLEQSTATVGEKVWQVIDYYRPRMKNTYDDYKKRLKDIEVVGSIAERYRSLSALLADMAIEPPIEAVEDITTPSRDEETLTLSTIHSAKGLEWRVVFILWALDGRFPPVRAWETQESLEEERRLFYVACTRAKERLFITYPINIFDRESGMVLSKVSRFLDGVDETIAERYILLRE
ncbi:MAG: ATP-dependent helicase [Bacteroidota bacterium]|nr:ATP-dependent helicase [Candidatus Kapabacteria bacterium]MDW8220418.1 ATP-dependent helicase [Bacteroidota bacterium]